MWRSGTTLPLTWLTGRAAVSQWPIRDDEISRQDPVAVVVLLAGSLLAACSSPPTSASYDIAVTALIDGQEVTGHATYQTTVLDPVPGVPIQSRTRGEAVRLSFSDGRTYYALKRGQGETGSISFGFYAASCLSRGMTTGEDLLSRMREFAGPCDGTPLPEVVRFADEHNPASIQIVRFRPYGPECVNYCLRVTVLRSQQPVTTGIVTHLPWLALGSMSAPIGSGEQQVVTVLPGKFYNFDFSTEIERSGEDR